MSATIGAVGAVGASGVVGAVGLAASALLGRWQNFYVIVGSAAAALTGLQFVVIALVAQIRIRSSPDGIHAFSTPTIVYFSAVLLLSSALCAPWNSLESVAVAVALFGVAGTVYTAAVTRRAMGQRDYKMVLEDVLWHILFPVATQLTLLAAGLVLPWHPVAALFAVGAAALILLVIGIHNAWDTVTYFVIERLQPGAPADSAAQSEPAAPPEPGAQSEAAAQPEPSAS